MPRVLQRKTPTEEARRNGAEVTLDTCVAHFASIVDSIMTSPDHMRFVTCPRGQNEIADGEFGRAPCGANADRWQVAVA